MIPFAHVSLQQLAIQILAVGTVAGRKVFAERHDSRGRHGYTRRSSMAEFLLPKAMQLAMACSTWSLRPMSGTESRSQLGSGTSTLMVGGTTPSRMASWVAAMPAAPQAPCGWPIMLFNDEPGSL